MSRVYNANFNSTNILILSPNDISSKYISSVLPELGEENVQQTTFDTIVQKLLGDRQLDKGQMFYEDCAPLLYLKLRLEDRDMFTEIKQVVIDEAQDYYPLQYEVFKLLFKDARYTVLGDINQAIEKAADNSLYADITQILDKKKTLKLFLNKGYRSSFEINAFAQKLRAGTQQFVPFERHEAEPMVVFKDNPKMVDQAIVQDIADYTGQGYESIAIICKTSEAAESLFARLKKLTNIALVAANQGGTYQREAYQREANDGEIKKGVLIIPAYMAKELEFDVVIVHGVTKENYSSEFDKKLLYVACTRELHRLVLYYTGEKSPLF